MEKIKVEIDLLKLRTDIIHKKILVFIGTVTGSWIYGLDFADKDKIALSIFAFSIFGISVIGTFISILKLSKIEKKVEKLTERLNDVI